MVKVLYQEIQRKLVYSNSLSPNDAQQGVLADLLFSAEGRLFEAGGVEPPVDGSIPSLRGLYHATNN